jgi:hypothetical protein
MNPIKLGTGRIILRDLTNSTDTVIVAGGPRTLVDGRVLTIIPPADIADGEMQLGRISGWECHHGPGNLQLPRRRHVVSARGSDEMTARAGE